MKNKTAVIILICVTFVFQFIFPVSLIAEKELIIKYGAEYNLLISSISYEDKNTLKIFYHGENNLKSDSNYLYAEITNINDDLWAFEKSVVCVPETSSYLKSSTGKEFHMPVRFYTLTDNTAQQISEKAIAIQNTNRYFYTKIKVLNGKSVITGIFLDDGTPVETLNI